MNTFVKYHFKDNNNTCIFYDNIGQVMAEHLTIDEEADIKEMFEQLDVEKKGELTFDELKEALYKQGHDLPDSDARMIMDAVSVI